MHRLLKNALSPKTLAVSVAMTALGLGLAWPAAAADRLKLYVFNNDFPRDFVVMQPSPPKSTTRFWQHLNQAMDKTDTLHLTNVLEEADYQVYLRCTGIVYCRRLQVAVKNPNRDLLFSFSVPASHDLARLGDMLAENLAQRLAAVDKGGVGSFGYTQGYSQSVPPGEAGGMETGSGAEPGMSPAVNPAESPAEKP